MGPHWKQTPVSNDEPRLKPEHSGTQESQDTRRREDTSALSTEPRCHTQHGERRGPRRVQNLGSCARPVPPLSLFDWKKPPINFVVWKAIGQLRSHSQPHLLFRTSKQELLKNAAGSRAVCWPACGGDSGLGETSGPLGRVCVVALSVVVVGRSGLQGLGRALAPSWRLVGAFPALSTTLHLASDSWHGRTDAFPHCLRFTNISQGSSWSLGWPGTLVPPAASAF